MNHKYQVNIQWSEEDNLFLISFPEFDGQKWHGHGSTYQEALLMGKEVLIELIDAYQQSNIPLPKPNIVNPKAIAIK